MQRMGWAGLVLILLWVPVAGFGGTGLKSGPVDLSSGVPDKDLRYEDFQITPDGFITGYIVNHSGKVRPGVRLDMWTTNRNETRILWRKSLTLGDIGPRERKLVKEVYKEDSEEPARTEIKFRIPSGANFRNK